MEDGDKALLGGGVAARSPRRVWVPRTPRRGGAAGPAGGGAGADSALLTSGSSAGYISLDDEPSGPVPSKSPPVSPAGAAPVTPSFRKAVKTPTGGRVMSTNNTTVIPADAKARKPVAKWVFLAIALVILVISGSGIQVYLRRTIQVMSNYSYFVFQSGAIAYCPIVLSVTLYKLFFTDHISKDTRSWRMLPKFCILALLDSLNDFSVVIGSAHTTVALQTLLPQAALPVSMLMSAIFLRARFTLLQISSALLILAGVVIIVWPTFAQNDGGVIGFEILLFCGAFPASMSALYKQFNFQEKKVDVFYLTTCVSALQVVVGFLLSPVNALLPPTEGGVPVSLILPQFGHGTECLVGINTVTCQVPGTCDFPTAANASYVNNTLATCIMSGNPPATSTLNPCDTCGDAWWVWLLFVLFVFIFNIMLLQIVKHGNAALMYAGNAMVLPVSNVISTMPSIMGEGNTQVLSAYSIWGMVVMLVAMAIWAYTIHKEEAAQAAQHPGEEPATPYLGGGRFVAPVPLQMAWRIEPAAELKPRSQLAVKQGLYARLGVSSPGPGRQRSVDPAVGSGSGSKGLSNMV